MMRAPRVTHQPSNPDKRSLVHSAKYGLSSAQLVEAKTHNAGQRLLAMSNAANSTPAPKHVPSSGSATGGASRAARMAQHHTGTFTKTGLLQPVACLGPTLAKRPLSPTPTAIEPAKRARHLFGHEANRSTAPGTRGLKYMVRSSPRPSSSLMQPAKRKSLTAHPDTVTRNIATNLSSPSLATTPTTPSTPLSAAGHTNVQPKQVTSVAPIGARPKSARALKAERTIRGLKADPQSGIQMAQIAQLAKPMFHFLVLDNPFGLENQLISHRSAAIRAIVSVQSEHETLCVNSLGIDYSSHEDIIRTIMSSAPSFRGQFKDRARLVVKDHWNLHELSAESAAQEALHLCADSRFIYQDENSRKPYRHPSLFEVMKTFLLHRTTGLTQGYGVHFESSLDSIMRKPPFVAFALTAIDSALREYAASDRGYTKQRFDAATFGKFYTNHLKSVIGYKDTHPKPWKQIGDDLLDQARDSLGIASVSIGVQPVIQWDCDNDDDSDGYSLENRYGTDDHNINTNNHGNSENGDSDNGDGDGYGDDNGDGGGDGYGYGGGDGDGEGDGYGGGDGDGDGDGDGYGDGYGNSEGEVDGYGDSDCDVDGFPQNSGLVADYSDDEDYN